MSAEPSLPAEKARRRCLPKRSGAAPVTAMVLDSEQAFVQEPWVEGSERVPARVQEPASEPELR